MNYAKKPKRDAFYDFIDKRLSSDVLENLHYQFIKRLEQEGLITLKELFIDGTKIEANANRYTFVWRGSINYHLAGLLDKIDALYKRYNEYITTMGFVEKYEIGEAVMFVIEGMDKVREIIEKNRKRKLTKHKKLSNNRRIEINNCSPLELLKLQEKHIKTEKRNNNGYIQTYEVYGCSDCSGCPYKPKCLYKYNDETDREKTR